jgi:hypothetical protein
VDFLGASSRTPLTAGSFVLVPPDTEHGVRITGTGPARWLAVWPSALDGMFEELAAAGHVDPATYDEIRLRHGMKSGRDRSGEFPAGA